MVKYCAILLITLTTHKKAFVVINAVVKKIITNVLELVKGETNKYKRKFNHELAQEVKVIKYRRKYDTMKKYFERLRKPELSQYW